MTERPVKAYDVSIGDYPLREYYARSRAKASYKAFIDYREVFPDVTFDEFSRRRRIRLSPLQGLSRVLVLDKPATLLHGRSGNYVRFVYDGSDAELNAHPSDVAPMPVDDTPDFDSLLLRLKNYDPETGTRECTRCHERKDISMFHRFVRHGNQPAIHSFCKDCYNAMTSSRRKTPEGRENRNAYIRSRADVPSEKARRQRSSDAARERYPEKHRARWLTRNAIATGKLVAPLLCEACGQVPAPDRKGRIGVQAHHDDYSKPFEVRWLCQKCHVKHHYPSTGEQA